MWLLLAFFLLVELVGLINQSRRRFKCRHERGARVRKKATLDNTSIGAV
jgi:hypothetical protein